MSNKWISKNRCKFLLQYRIILVCKYRHSIFKNKKISDDIKQFSYDICNKNDIKIKYMETDIDHIHYMIETNPNISISKLIKLLKSYTTYHIWKSNPLFLQKYYWKEHTFWTDGYFVASVGDVSAKSLQEYIQNQE